ncbi:hypothetical protein [Streptomyces sp. SAI-229]
MAESTYEEQAAAVLDRLADAPRTAAHDRPARRHDTYEETGAP